MVSVPKWINNLMVEERARTSGPVPTTSNYSCPALIPDVAIVTICSNKKTIPVCASYERSARESGFFPSPDSCPSCAYNTDNIGAEADKRLANSISEFLKS